jgi:hypothetical protein
MSKVRMTKHVRELVELADDFGWELSFTGGGHLAFRKPGRQPVFAGSTPSDHRARKNLIKLLARAEAQA